MERAFTVSALGLIGRDIREEDIVLLQQGYAGDSVASSESERKILSALASIRFLLSIQDPGSVSLTPASLLQIHGGSPGADPGLDDTNAAHDAESAAVNPRIRILCDWVSSESFKELNALEQAAIVILRLLEIRPFAEGNVRVALAAGSLFTMRRGWPPIIVPAALRHRFNPAVAEGMRMNTRPMVDLLADSTLETLDAMIGLVKG